MRRGSPAPTDAAPRAGWGSLRRPPLPRAPPPPAAIAARTHSRAPARRQPARPTPSRPCLRSPSQAPCPTPASPMSAGRRFSAAPPSPTADVGRTPRHQAQAHWRQPSYLGRPPIDAAIAAPGPSDDQIWSAEGAGLSLSLSPAGYLRLDFTCSWSLAVDLLYPELWCLQHHPSTALVHFPSICFFPFTSFLFSICFVLQIRQRRRSGASPTAAAAARTRWARSRTRE